MKSITLESALAMLRTATGPSAELQRTIPLVFFDRGDYPKVGTLASNACGEYGALDACVELAEYLLPEKRWRVSLAIEPALDREPERREYWARCGSPEMHNASTPALALLAALLSRLIAAKASGAGMRP